MSQPKPQSNSQSKPQAKPNHHHGDLKRALITAGLALLEEGGLESLSLRKCAARAGVSHAAPAHHFDGLSGLIAAIAEEGFIIFSRYMQSEVDSKNQDPRARLHSVCCGYLQFGLDHAGLLRVMFGEHGLAQHAPTNGREEADAYLILRDVCAPFVPDGMDQKIIEIQVWSLIHGFTMLYLAGEFGVPFPPVDAGPFEAVMALLDSLGAQSSG